MDEEVTPDELFKRAKGYEIFKVRCLRTATAVPVPEGDTVRLKLAGVIRYALDILDVDAFTLTCQETVFADAEGRIDLRDTLYDRLKREGLKVVLESRSGSF